MPENPNDNKFINALMQRPAPTQGPVSLREVPFKDEDAFTRFMGGLIGDGLGAPLGDMEGGGVPAVAGATIGMFGPGMVSKLIGAARNFTKARSTAAPALEQVGKTFQRSKMPAGAMNEFQNMDTVPKSKHHVGTPVDENIKLPTPAELANSVPGRQHLPQVHEAFDASGRYKPEIAAEQARLMSEMMDDPAEKLAFKIFAEKSPMGAGHVERLVKEPFDVGILERIFGRKTTGAQIGRNKPVPGFPEAEYLSTIQIDPKHSVYKHPLERAKTMGHELTHAAQQVREGRALGPNYLSANETVGYRDNPYETQANVVSNAIVDVIKQLMTAQK